MSAPKRRYLFDRLVGGLIRTISLLVGLGVVGMFLQMILVAWPLFEPLSVSEGVDQPEPQPTGLLSPDHSPVAAAMSSKVVILHLPGATGEIALSNRGDRLLAELRSPNNAGVSPEAYVFPSSLALNDLSMASVDSAGGQMILIFTSGAYWLLGVSGSSFFQASDNGNLVPHRRVLAVPGLQSWVLVTATTLEQVHLVFEGGRPSLRPLRGIELPDEILHVSEVSRDRQLLVTTRSGNVFHWQLGGAEATLLPAVGARAVKASWLEAPVFRAAYDDGTSRRFDLEGQSRGFVAQRLFTRSHYEGYRATGYYWQPSATSDGFESKVSLVPLLAGTLKAALVALFLAIPVAVGAAIFVGYLLPARRREQIKPLIEVIASFPTVVVAGLAAVWLAPRLIGGLPELVGAALAIPVAGLVGFVFLRAAPIRGSAIGKVRALPVRLVPVLFFLALVGAGIGHLVESQLPGGSLLAWLTQRGVAVQQLNSVLVGLVLGFAITPTIFSLAEEAVYEVPRIGAAGSIALGATSWRSFSDVVLPIAAPGIISAIMLGFGRAIGETMVFLLVSGNAPVTDWNLFASVRSLSATLAIELPEAAVGSLHFRVLFLGALLLFVLTFIVNTLGHLIRRRMRSRYRPH